MSCPTQPEAPQPYTGIDLCASDNELSNEHKKTRCKQIGRYIVYVATFFNSMIEYMRCKMLQIQSMVGRAETAQIRAETALNNIEEAIGCLVIPEEATYDKCHIDEMMCDMMNNIAYNQMEKDPCCCKPYVKLII